MDEQTGRTFIAKNRERPIIVIIEGENGERENYLLKAAGRKFGACLSKPESSADKPKKE